MALDTPTLLCQLIATYTGAASVGNATPSFPINYTAGTPLTTGTGANQADKVYTTQFNISASGTLSLDLNAGGLTDVFGAVFTVARIKAIVIKANSTNVNDVQLTRPASNGIPLFGAASDYIVIRPGGFFAWSSPDATGVAVTAATADLINLVNSAGGTAVTGDLIIIGSSV